MSTSDVSTPTTGSEADCRPCRTPSTNASLARVEAVELSSESGAHELDDDRAVDGRDGRSGPLFDQLARDLVEQRRITFLHELFAESAAERLRVARVLRQALLGLEEVVQGGRVDGQLEGEEPDRCPIRVRERFLDRRAELAVDRAEEHDRVPAVDQPVLHQRRIGVVDQVLRMLEHLLLARPAFPRRVQLVLELGDPARAQGILGAADLSRQRDTQDDPDGEREKDRRERGDVIAEIEHLDVRSVVGVPSGTHQTKSEGVIDRGRG